MTRSISAGQALCRAPPALRLPLRTLRCWDKSSGARRRHDDAIWTAHPCAGDLFEELSGGFLRAFALPVRDAFGLIVSEGALMNMFIRSHAGSRSRPIRRRPSFARRRSSPATKPACGSKGPILIIGSSTARMRSCISQTIHAAPASWSRDGHDAPIFERLLRLTWLSGPRCDSPRRRFAMACSSSVADPSSGRFVEI